MQDMLAETYKLIYANIPSAIQKSVFFGKSFILTIYVIKNIVK